jgi:hypothetical protein
VHLLLAEPLYYNTNIENLIYGQTCIWHLLNQTPNNTPLPPPQNKYLLIIKSSMINISIHSMICLLEHLGGYFVCLICGCSQFSLFLFALNLDCIKASRVLSACIIMSFAFLVCFLAVLYIVLIWYGRILLYVHLLLLYGRILLYLASNLMILLLDLYLLFKLSYEVSVDFLIYSYPFSCFIPFNTYVIGEAHTRKEKKK